METNSTRKLQHVLDTINPNWYCPWSPFCCRGSLSPLIPPDGGGHNQKCIRSKNRWRFEKPTFPDLSLCALAPGWFEYSKCPKKASCLWIRRFSSHVKRCMHVCLQRFTRELNRLNQRQGTFLGHLKCSNHPEAKAQSCRSQKVGFSKCHLFFDLMHFHPWPLPSCGF